MADEISDSLKTPEKNEVDKNRALRRTSLGFCSPKSLQNVGSRYLRASTGSCHDFCKYGIKHSSDEKATEQLRRRYVKEINGVPSLQKKNKVAVNPKTKSLNSSPETKTYYATKSKTSSSINKGKVVKNKLSTEDTKNEYDQSHSPRQKPSTSKDGRTYSQGKNRTLLPQQSPSSAKKLSSPDPPEIIKSVFFPSEKIEVPTEQCSLPANEVQRSVRKSGVVRGKGGRNKAVTDQTVTAYQGSAKKVLAPPATSLSHKLSLLKSKRNGNRLSSPIMDRNRTNKVKINTSNDDKSLENTSHASSKTEAANAIESDTDNNSVSLLPSPSSSKSLSSKNDDGEADEFISEKAYAATGRQSPVEENHNKTDTTSDEKTEASVPDDVPVQSLPSPSLSNSLSPKHSDGEADKFIFNNNDCASTFSPPPMEEKNRIKTMKKSRAIVSVSEGKPSMPVKLKFRSKKALDLQSDNYRPRRIKFSKARVLKPEDGNSSSRRTFKNTGIVDDAAAGDGVGISSEKLVSKHQDKYISNNNEHASIVNRRPSKDDNYNKTVRKNRAAVSVSESKRSAPVKLKFRAGKVVDLQTNNYSTPRRLKFRKARVLGADDSNSYLKRQSLKKAGFDDEAAATTDQVGISSEKDVFENRDNVEDKAMRNKAAVSVSKSGKQSAPVKFLKFGSGKVVDLQSDNYSPRRLKFRRPRVIEAEDSNSYSRRRTLKKADGAGMSSEKVVLKHQDVQDKKDAQGLFNNVIEETASKLVESRKSKVKALVGAFETVISLQESKPSN